MYRKEKAMNGNKARKVLKIAGSGLSTATLTGILLALGMAVHVYVAAGQVKAEHKESVDEKNT